ncbi:hypothetical protein Dda_4575 [Drechslerella dactyloides]|uniref:Uncharacterized protein n=1 Tax=Drechslerella dactyloides TaxID=74499 RepID=A0AAD6NJ86_DREDA|nr:hypothetical protein Dda_4575 [Drechslerella dactyloides]
MGLMSRKTRSQAAKANLSPMPPAAAAASPSRKRKEPAPQPADADANLPPRKRLKTINAILDKAAREKGQSPLRLPEPATPPAKIVLDPAAGPTASVLRSTESDHALRLLIEEKILQDPKVQAMPERTRRMVVTVRAETERKKLKAQQIRERRALREWNAFKHRLERQDLPADKHLHGPVMPGTKRVRPARGQRGQQQKQQRQQQAQEQNEASDVGEVLERWKDSAVVEDAGKLPESPTLGVRVPTKWDSEGPAMPAELPAIPSSPAAETAEEPTAAASKDEKPRKRKLFGSFKARIRAWQQETIAKKIERYQGRRERAIKLKGETLAAIKLQRQQAEQKKEKKRARKGAGAAARRLLAELSEEAAAKCGRINAKIAELDEELAALEELAAKLSRRK